MEAQTSRWASNSTTTPMDQGAIDGSLEDRRPGAMEEKSACNLKADLYDPTNHSPGRRSILTSQPQRHRIFLSHLSSPCNDPILMVGISGRCHHTMYEPACRSLAIYSCDAIVGECHATWPNTLIGVSHGTSISFLVFPLESWKKTRPSDFTQSNDLNLNVTFILFKHLVASD